MKHKRYLLVVLVAFFTLISICFIMIIIQSESSRLGGDNIILSSYPQSFPVSHHVVTIGDNPTVGFKYANITSDDNLELLNETGTKFIISLDKREWKDITWSTDGTLVSMLGRDDANNYDIYIYDVSKQALIKETSFDSFPVGVDTYKWVDHGNILFTQGNYPDRWLTKFNLQSMSVLKIAKITWSIVGVSSDMKYLIVKDNSNFSLIDQSGNQVLDFNTFIDSDFKKIVPLAVSISEKSDKFLITTSNGIYKVGFTDNSAVKLNFYLNYQLICDVSEDIFSGLNYTSGTSTLVFDSLNERSQTSSNISLQAFGNISSFDFSKSDCINKSSILFKAINTDNTVSWYTSSSNSFKELVILKGMKEVSLVTKQNLFIIN